MTAHKTLDPKNIEKTLLGVVTDWRELFIEHRYSKTIRVGKPWVTPHPPEYYFLASTLPGVKMFGPPNSWLTLYVKPNPKIEPVVHGYCTPPINGPQRRSNFQSFTLTPWPDYGMVLVTATDWNCIAHPWVCFIPMEAIPDINPENTAMVAPEDYLKENS